MKNKESNGQSIPTEVIAAYLDGTATAEESQQVLDALAHDAELREFMDISLAVDDELQLSDTSDILPMAAMAAQNDVTNTCSIVCEQKILSKFSISIDTDDAVNQAESLFLLRAEGTYLFNVGRLCEAHGLIADRQYKRTIADIIQALKNNDGVIAVVDGNELLGNPAEEYRKDITLGNTPNHAVVIESVNTKDNTVTIFDPNNNSSSDTYSINMFLDAWQDSQCYLVCINTPDRKSYTPHPIDLTDVTFPSSLHELQEAIAENAHEVWAANRQQQGWTYGTKRDDDKKQTPDMIPYASLPESEKLYDREMAMNTLKLIKKLGWQIRKR